MSTNRKRLVKMFLSYNSSNKRLYLQIGVTALHFAADNGHSEIVEQLLEAGATDNPDQVYTNQIIAFNSSVIL